MKLMLTGIALLALLTAGCGDSDSDGDTVEDSGSPSSTDDEDTDEPTDSDDAGEPTEDDDETDEPMDDGGGSTMPPPPPPPEPISCGDVDCPAPPFGTPCCATAEDVEVNASLTEGACGVDLSPVFGGPSACVEFAQPGDPDESCPALEVPDADPIPGCCTSHGFCGTMDTFIGIGCTTPPPEFGEPIPCGAGGGDAGSPGGDAGSTSSGDDAGSPSGDAGEPDMPEPDAGETTEEPIDSGSTSEPADASMSIPDAATSDAGDASL
jgi:hypothetical protein